MWPSVSGFKVHPRGSKCQGCTPSYGARTWRRANEPHFVSPFASRWAFGWFPLSAAVNNTPLSICVPVLAQTCVFFSLGRKSRGWNCWVKCALRLTAYHFEELSERLPEWLLRSSIWGFQFLPILTSACSIFFFFQIYLAVPGLCCGTQDLELQHSGSSSLTRNGTGTPCIGSIEP